MQFGARSPKRVDLEQYGFAAGGRGNAPSGRLAQESDMMTTTIQMDTVSSAFLGVHP